MERRWNARAGETGVPRENPPTSGIVQHDLHMRKSGSEPTGYRTRIAVVGVSALANALSLISKMCTALKSVGWTPVGPPRQKSRSEGAIRATLTRTPSASSLLRARRAMFPSTQPHKLEGDISLARNATKRKVPDESAGLSPFYIIGTVLPQRGGRSAPCEEPWPPSWLSKREKGNSTGGQTTVTLNQIQFCYPFALCRDFHLAAMERRPCISADVTGDPRQLTLPSSLQPHWRGLNGPRWWTGWRARFLPTVQFPAESFSHKRCCWSADFLRDLSFLPLFHSGAGPYSPCFAIISSQDPDTDNTKRRVRPKSPILETPDPFVNTGIFSLGIELQAAPNAVPSCPTRVQWGTGRVIVLARGVDERLRECERQQNGLDVVLDVAFASQCSLNKHQRRTVIVGNCSPDHDARSWYFMSLAYTFWLLPLSWSTLHSQTTVTGAKAESALITKHNTAPFIPQVESFATPSETGCTVKVHPH
ncbi:hypothetical protein PR048_015477 [Dryococelus australis]|uniref:Uncharacterized protein n=1 Tax=Dryococelus australis TaxID=614101 RepID=A0ABQ9HH74_9NEOP|nr:hypothetical protein PR048_015477 [Dryococelus australis]